MAYVASGSVVRQLGSLFEGGSAAGLSDRQLLERFATARDEAAFAAMVARHGPMVLGACRQLLGDHQHAEDAFQAVFLVLARKAGSLRQPDLLGNWLYGVAMHTARRARARLDRRRQVEEEGAVRRPEARPAVQAEQMIAREQAEALHREIDRLPVAFRRAVVLCYFEGLSPDEAAERLRWPGGTLRSRLVRARERLRRGLLRRGVVLSTTAIAGALAPRSASASVSSLLCDSTSRAAIAFAARHAAVGGAPSAPAAVLVREVLRSMLIHKLKLTAMSLLFIAALAAGAGWLARTMAMKEEPVKQPTASKARATPRTTPDPAPAGRMTVTGRVLGPDGKPAEGVPVDIVGTSRAPERDTDGERAPYIMLGQGATESDGRFRIEASRASSSRFSAVYALAGAAGPGSGFGCVKLHPDAEQPTAEIPLPPEQVIRGKLVDISGRPAAGVEVQLKGAYGTYPPRPDAMRFDSPALPGRGPVWPSPPPGLRALPGSVTTDAQGRFTLAGVGQGLDVLLSVRDPRFAQQRFDLQAGGRDAGKEVSLALHPATTIEGRVIAADTGQPIPHARISVRSSFGPPAPFFTTGFRADGQGRFKINPYAGDNFGIRAIPPEGQPYLPAEAEIAWTKGAVRKELDLKVPRGLLIRGKVTEQGTGRPVPGADVEFVAMRRPGDIVTGAATAKEDGSFQLAVPPGKGTLMVLAPTLDYILQEIGGGRLYGGSRRGGRRYYAHDIIAYEARDGGGPQEINATLRPGRTLRGRVVSPAGGTVADAAILTRQQIDPHNHIWLGHNFIRVRDGRFELPGFDPEQPSPAYFLDPDHEWGAAVELSGRQADEELTVRLQPCGRANARFVGPDGKPVAGLNVMPYFHLLMTPGATLRTSVVGGEQLEADEAFLSNFDFKHYPNGPSTDADGRVTLPDLIPGAPYRVGDWSTVNVQDKGVQLRKDFTVKPGETVDLGDILVEKPGE